MGCKEEKRGMGHRELLWGRDASFSGNCNVRRLLGKERARADQEERREGTEAPRPEHTCHILELKAGQWTRASRERKRAAEWGWANRQRQLAPSACRTFYESALSSRCIENHMIHSASEDADCDCRQDRGKAEGPVGVVNGVIFIFFNKFNIEVLQVNLDTSVVRCFIHSFDNLSI